MLRRLYVHPAVDLAEDATTAIEVERGLYRSTAAQEHAPRHARNEAAGRFRAMIRRWMNAAR